MSISLEDKRVFLTSDELAIIEEKAKRRERVIRVLEKIKGMDESELSRFFDYCPTDPMGFRAVHTNWIDKARYLLGTRIGRSPRSYELKEDIEKHNTARRFQAFYVLMYPEFVRKRQI